MKKIKYEGKHIKLPFPVGLSDDPTAMGSVTNRFTGELAALPEFAIAVYDVIMGSEQLATNRLSLLPVALRPVACGSRR